MLFAQALNLLARLSIPLPVHVNNGPNCVNMWVIPSPTFIAAFNKFWNIGGPILLMSLNALFALLDELTQSRILADACAI